MNLPSRLEEPPLKVSQLEVTLGGRWNGAAFSGGYQLATELRGVTWTMKNNLTPESTPGAGGNYANRAFRTGREQSLKFDRDFRDFLLAQNLKDNDTLGVRLMATGPEFEPGLSYQVELIFPGCRCWPPRSRFTSAAWGKRWSLPSWRTTPTARWWLTSRTR